MTLHDIDHDSLQKKKRHTRFNQWTNNKKKRSKENQVKRQNKQIDRQSRARTETD